MRNHLTNENTLRQCTYNFNKYTGSKVRLINKFHKLWEQHDVWTRSIIMSIAFDLPDLSPVTKRLLQNPVDFGHVFKIYYGNEIGSKFSELLAAHLVIAKDIVVAAKAGDNKTEVEAEKKWYENADEIATFLGCINPFWSEKEWRLMMHQHLKLVKTEAVYILTGSYSPGVAVYDEIELQTLKMADMMAEGIFKQFPCYFKK